MFDTQADGGIRMSSQAVTLEGLKKRLLEDPSFPDAASHSEMYDCLFRGSAVWSDLEFDRLGGVTCTNRLFDW